MTKQLALALPLALVAVACSDAVTPLPREAVRLEPHAIYHRWWNQVLACSERTGTLGAVEFFVVPGASSLHSSIGPAAGFYDPAAGRIVLAGDFELNGFVVRHEMLHALLPREKHPREFFAERCYSLVSCDGACVQEAGVPVIPSSAVPTPIEDLVVEASVEPSAPSAEVDGGRFMLVLTARNPHAFAIRVNLSPSLDPDPRPYGFSMRVESETLGMFGTTRLFDAGASHFRAHEVRRIVYDFVVGSTRGSDHLAPGEYTFTGNFSGVPTTTAAPFVIPPY